MNKTLKFISREEELFSVDISENSMVELVLDIGSVEYDTFIKNDGKCDYVLNFPTLKQERYSRNF